MTTFQSTHLIHAMRVINSDKKLSEHVFDILVAKQLKYQFFVPVGGEKHSEE